MSESTESQENELPCYVVAADQDLIEINCADPALVKQLVSIGFVSVGGDTGPNHYSMAVIDDEQKIAAFERLQQMGVAFAGGTSGWNPCDLFRMFIEQGHLSFPFHSIFWSGPGNWNVNLEQK